MRVVDPFRRREIFVESGLEYDFILVMIARSDVREIREQQRPDRVPASNVDRYFVDTLTVRYDGLRTAYEVKHVEDVTDEVTSRLKLLANDAGDDFADEFYLITEANLSTVAIENAKLIVDCGNDADLDAQDAVRNLVTGRSGFVTARQIGRDTALGERGVRAAFALVQSGLLQPPRGARLDRDVMLEVRKERRLSK